MVTISAMAPPERARAADRRGVTTGCWVAVSLWAVIALARWLGYDGSVWPFVLLPAMTPYLTLGALLPLALCLLARRWRAALATLAVLAALIGFVAPRAFGGPEPARG